MDATARLKVRLDGVDAFRAVRGSKLAAARGYDRFDGFEQVQQVPCELTLMLRQELCHPSHFGDRFPGPCYLGRRWSGPLGRDLLDVGAHVCVKAGTHLLGLTLVVLKSTCQPAVVPLSGTAAVLTVEVLASSRPGSPKELLVASRVGAGGLEILSLVVVSALRYANDFTGQPRASYDGVFICAF